MLRITKTILYSILLAAILVGLMLVPIFAASGVVAYFWNGAVLDTVLGNPPNRQHPAFWVFLCLMIVGMLVTAVLGYCLICLPFFAKLKRDGSDVKLSDEGFPLLSILNNVNRYLAERMGNLARAYEALMMVWLSKK
jgi:MFS family permease